MLLLMLQHVSSRVSGFPVASACLWGKLQNLSCFNASKQVVTWFCVAGVALRGILSCVCKRVKIHFVWQAQYFCILLRTLHSTLHTPDTTLPTLHFTLYTLHSTFGTPPSSTFHSLQCTGTVTGEKCRLLKYLVSQKCSTWLHSASWVASCFFLRIRLEWINSRRPFVGNNIV